MTKRKMESLRRRLEKLRVEIEQSLRTQEEEYRELSAENLVEVIDEAQTRMETQLHDVVRVHDERRLTRVRAALRRIREGAYGACLACGSKIDLGRLDARPEAAFCIGCERKQEKG